MDFLSNLISFSRIFRLNTQRPKHIYKESDVENVDYDGTSHPNSTLISFGVNGSLRSLRSQGLVIMWGEGRIRAKGGAGLKGKRGWGGGVGVGVGVGGRLRTIQTDNKELRTENQSGHLPFCSTSIEQWKKVERASRQRKIRMRLA